MSIRKETKGHHTNETELKTRFDREISAPDKDLLWQWLGEDHYVSEVCRGAMGWDEFEAEARRLADRQWKLLGRERPPGRRYHTVYVEVEMTDLEAEHGAALAPYLAKRAALLSEVRGFREEKLGGNVLVETQVAGFLRSELRYSSSGKYEDLEWALAQIPWDIEDENWEELKDLVGGSTNRGLGAESHYWTKNFRRAVEYDSEYDSMPWDYIPPREFPHGVMHLIRDQTGRTLEDLGRWLVSRYPWPLRDAAWFMLTGEPPEVEALNIERNPTTGTYSVTLAPWISEKTFRQAYRAIHTGDNRPLGYKSLSAFRFVDRHTEVGQAPTWAELTERWNKLYPEDNFTDRSALRRAYRRAEDRLAWPWAEEERRAAEEDEADLAEPDVWS